MQLLNALGFAFGLSTVTSPATDSHFPQVQKSMVLGGAVTPPIGYLEFCGRRPDQCVAAEGLRDKADQRLAQTDDDHLSYQYIHRGGLANNIDSAQTPNSFEAAINSNANILGPTQIIQSLHKGIIPDAAVEKTLPDASIDNAGRLALTARVWASLSWINNSINSRIQPMSDEQAFGRSNYWTLPLTDELHPYGNCKHYALEKRKALVDAGVPLEDLSLAIVKTSGGELHEVLLVLTDHGEVVLDNLDGTIRGWSEPRYRWLVRQLPGQPLQWVGIERKT